MIKDWKKEHDTSTDILYLNKKTGKFLNIFYLHESLNWVTKHWVVTDKDFDRKYLKTFVTKTQALRFAKSYMRKN